MIIYKEIFEKLKDAGYPTTRIRKEKIVSEGTLQNIRNGKPVNLATIDTICNILECQPNHIIKHVPERK
jgi:putative transcriptional regulator